MDVYQIVTDKIISLLEQGTVPWKKPWVSSNSFPKNLVSNKEYRGINLFLLGCQQYNSPYWLTYKQATDKKGFIRKGEKSSLVIFYKMFDKQSEDEKDTGKIPMLRYYNLFNLDQCENIPSPATEIPTYQFTPIERAEQIIENMPNRPPITYGGNKAAYSPVTDSVKIPLENRFEKSEELYSVLYHELGHATGHQSRLGRKEVIEYNRFGSDPYATEELVAELTSSMLCGVAGISNETIDLAASYLDGWLSVLKKDKRLILTAAAQAQKASDFILNRKGGEEEVTEDQAA
jgi:antirestriction protein ArdC